MSWIITGTQKYPVGSMWSMTVNASDSSFSLITNAACDLGIDWGDGVNETISIASGVQTTTHTYASSGTYIIRFTVTGGNLVPYYNNNAEAQKITALGPSQYDWSFGTSLATAWYGGSNITSVDAGMDVSGVTNFLNTWRGCSSLTSFPLIDTSSGTSFREAWRLCSSLTSFSLIDTSSGTDFRSAWNSCNSLTSFPLIDTSSGTQFDGTWSGCSSLTSFPLINTSAGTSFATAWSTCSSLTSFPLIDIDAGTNFYRAWYNCSSLTDFPANFFDSWTGTPANECFHDTWDNCSSLTPASVVNILDSIAASGQSAPNGTGGGDKEITIDWDGTGDPATDAASAITTLKSRSWTIRLNGVLQ